MTADSVARQRAYYRDTAAEYDDMHPFTQHFVGLRQVVMYLQTIGAQTVLDTGCGTGLAMRYLSDAMPGITISGNDPSAALLEIAKQRHAVPEGRLVCASSEELPYEADDFDAVVETGMLHHVPDPTKVVKEMLRVGRHAIFISDTNMFGMGNAFSRIVKLGLYGVGMLQYVNRRRRGGHDWYYSDSDGVAWDYSVFQSLATIREACAEVFVVPTGPRERLADACPLLCSSHCLIVGLKAPLATYPVLSSVEGAPTR